MSSERALASRRAPGGLDLSQAGRLGWLVRVQGGMPSGQRTSRSDAQSCSAPPHQAAGEAESLRCHASLQFRLTVIELLARSMFSPRHPLPAPLARCLPRTPTPGAGICLSQLGSAPRLAGRRPQLGAP